MTRVDVSPDVLKWAAHRAGKAEVIQSDFPHWVQWINKESYPTLRQLEKISKMTSTPLGYFFLDEPPIEQLPIPHFRTVNDEHSANPSPELIDTIQSMQRRQEWMREYLINSGFDRLDFVGKRKTTDDLSTVAKEIRTELGLANGWAARCHTWQEALRMLLQGIEDIGILAIVNGVVGNNTHRKLDVNEFRGFVLVDDYAPLIFVNGADSKAAQMFTLAHELAHIWYGASAAFDLQKMQPADNRVEQVCNAVAAEFLVPELELREIWPRIHEAPNPFQQIARQFKVSEIVAARRALDLGMINRAEFFEFYQQRIIAEREEAPESSGGNFYATQTFRIGRRFAEAVIRATLEGKLLYSDAYRLTGLKGNTFSEFAARLGFGGDA